MATQEQAMDVFCMYLKRILHTSFRRLMEQTTSSCNNTTFQNTSRRLQRSSMTQLVAQIKGSNRGLDILLDHRSTLTSQHRSTDVLNLAEESLIFSVLGSSTGKRRISVESIEMIRDTPETLMDTPFTFTTKISEDFWKELREMSTATYVFQNMLAHSHQPSQYQRSTPRTRSMRCSMESAENKRRTKNTSR